MTEYLYTQPSHTVAFAGAPDDATHVVKLEGATVWAKLNDKMEMAIGIGGAFVWRELTKAELEEYELVAERTPIQQPSLDWKNAPSDAELILRSRKTGHPAWGKSQTDMSIMGLFNNESEWFPFPLKHWDIVSRRVPVTIATPTPYKPAPYEPTVLTPDNECWGFDSVDPIEGFVIAYHQDWLWFAANGALKPIATRLDKVTFTKPLTPEEKARAKAVSELADLIAYHVRRNPIDKLSEEDIANDIINAGYLKGENTL